MQYANRKQKPMYESANNIISTSFSEKIVEKKKIIDPGAKNFKKWKKRRS